MKFVLLVCFAAYLPSTATGQSKVDEFWKTVKQRYELNNISAGLKSWLVTEAEKDVKQLTYTDVLAKLESMDKNKAYQTQVSFDLYMRELGDKESIRFVLNGMCGSYTLANPVGDNVITKYQNDKDAIRMVNERKAAGRAQEEEKLAKQREEEGESARRDDELNKNIQETIAKSRKHDSLMKIVEALNESRRPENATYDEVPVLKYGSGRFWEKWQAYQKEYLHYPNQGETENIKSSTFVSIVVDNKGEVKNAVIELGQEDHSMKKPCALSTAHQESGSLEERRGQ